MSKKKGNVVALTLSPFPNRETYEKLTEIGREFYLAE